MLPRSYQEEEVIAAAGTWQLTDTAVAEEDGKWKMVSGCCQCSLSA